ncbi:MAG: hypothetical protein L0227_00785, partial [Chloroflexi bacterium]|nr:hypothetical protein [Chloroflexota bacterium]
MEAAGTGDRDLGAGGRFAWLSVAFAAWIVGGLVLVVWALNHDLTDDIGVSPYHAPFYAAVLALAALSLILVRRAVTAGRRWQEAFPAGYGGLGAGLLALLAWPIVDVGWREGIGIPMNGIEAIMAPSRLLLALGALLVASGPLRVALREPSAATPRWAVVLSAAFGAMVLGAIGGFQPAQNPWLETARFEPEMSSEVWIMNRDGTGQTRLIEPTDEWLPSLPAWSPDGTKVAFVMGTRPERTGIPSDDLDIWLASADGTNQRLLVGGTGWQWLPHWSPDGSWITYTVDGPGGPGQGAGLRAPFFGFGQVPGFGQPPAVSPDVDVWRIRADGTGTPERLTDDPADDRAGAYSPDGEHLLFDSTRAEGRMAIYVADADGGNPVRLTFFGDDWGGAWSPDGTRIAFHAYPEGGAEDLYVVSYPDGAITQLTSEPTSETRPSWSPDGSRIAFTLFTEEPDVWSMSADGTDVVNLTRSPGVFDSVATGGGAWGPDDRIVYDRSTAGPAHTATFVRNELGTAAFLLEVILLVIVILVLVRTRPPFGAVAVVMAFSAAFAAIDGDDWRFVPAAIVGGLIVDLLIRYAAPGRKPYVAGAGVAAVYVLGAGVTVIVTAGLGWSPSLLLG